MRAARVALGVVGLAAAGWGLWLLFERGSENLWPALTWLVAGVIVHDALLAPATIAVATGLTVLSRRALPAAVIVGALVFATVTLTAIPVLGRFGALDDNPTLLDRNYGLGLVVFACLTLVGVGLGLLHDHRTRRGGERGASAGG